MPAYAVDTNILVRLLTGDMPAVARRQRSRLLALPPNSVLLDNAVVAELVYVLLSVKQYDLSRRDIGRMLKQLLALKQFACQREVIVAAADNFVKLPKLDFIDCLLLAHKQTGQVGRLLTLDNDLQKSST